MSSVMTLPRCPVTIGVNVDVESLDSANAGKGGLFGRHSYGRYGIREGIWRLLKEFSESAVQVTFYVVPEDALRHASVIEAILEHGHEIAVRGQVRKGPGESETLDSLEKDRDIIARLTGVQPRGWRAVNGLVTEGTLPALAELGYTYDSSAQDDDNPYVMQEGTKTLVELPVFDYLTDAVFYAHRHTDTRVRKAWAEEAHAQYCAGGYINLTIHTRGDTGSTRPPRVNNVVDFINNTSKRPEVAFYKAADLADAWKAENSARESFPTKRAAQIPA